MVWKVGSRVLPKKKARVSELGPGVSIKKGDKVWVVLFDKSREELEITSQQLKSENSGAPTRNPLRACHAGAGSCSRTGAQCGSNEPLGDHEEGEYSKLMTLRPQLPNIVDEIEGASSDDDDGDSTELPRAPHTPLLQRRCSDATKEMLLLPGSDCRGESSLASFGSMLPSFSDFCEKK